MIAAATISTSVALASFLTSHVPSSLRVAQALSAFAVAVAIYAWGVCSTAGSLAVTLPLLFCLGWAWATLRTVEAGAAFAALAVLLVVAAVQRRRRSGRALRMAQLLEDLAEESTVKDQAVHLARQTADNLRKKHGRYLQLQSIAERLSHLVDLGQIAQLAVDSAFELIGKSDVCLLFLVDDQRQELSLFSSRKADAVASIRAKHGDQFDRYVLRTHRPLLVNDVRRDFRFTAANANGRAISAVISCPLLLQQRAAGVLRLDSAHSGVYTQDDLRFLDILLDLVATAVANAQLFAQTRQLAMTDGLTGLLLRRPLLEQLDRELQRSQRGNDTLALLMLDLDEFKRYNDTFGHTAGDLILRSLAQILKAHGPPEAVTARYGGEEFTVLLPRTGAEAACRIAERIREAVARDLKVGGRADRLPVTVSIGLATHPADALAGLELIRVADQRLYRAKHDGRNRVCSA